MRLLLLLLLLLLLHGGKLLHKRRQPCLRFRLHGRKLLKFLLQLGNMLRIFRCGQPHIFRR